MILSQKINCIFFVFVNIVLSRRIPTVLRNNSFLRLFTHTWVGGGFRWDICFPLKHKIRRAWVRLLHSVSCVVKAGVFNPMPVTWEGVVEHSYHSLNWQTIWKKNIRKSRFNKCLPSKYKESHATLHVKKGFLTQWARILCNHVLIILYCGIDRKL